MSSWAPDLSTLKPIDQTTQQPPAPNPAAQLRQSVSYGVQQNPDDYAKLLRQQQVTGMAPEVAQPLANDTQQAIDVESLNPEGMVDSHPRTAAWATNPDNAAVSGAGEIHRLTRIEQHAATIRAYTPNVIDKASDALQSTFNFLGGSGSLKQKVFEYPLVRGAIGALRGTEEMLGNVGSFAGWHGDGPEQLNYIQRQARTLEPFNFGEDETGLDKLAANVGPMIPAMIATGGTGMLARTLGLSERAAKVLAGLGVGGMFTADQGGRTYNAMKEQGASDYDARLAANRVAAINAPANALFGATELVPFLRNNPFVSSIGLGAVTGASGQLAQNVVTGQPLTRDLASSTLEGAAVQGGLHFGTEFLESMGATIGEVEASKLRMRSQEKFQNAVDQIFEGDPSLRIPAQDFVNYFVGKDIDPGEMANRVGVKNLSEAIAAGQDLEISKPDYFAKLDPEHQKGLLEHLVDPQTGMSVRQAAEGRQELEQWIAGGGAEKLQAEFAAADAETQATPEWKKVKEDLKQRYVDAGEPEAAADSYAELQANAITNLAKRAGLKPDELLALHNPAIVEGEAPGGSRLNQADVRSPEFQRWFGESKVADEEGQPVMVYHGTQSYTDKKGVSFGNPEVFDRNYAKDYFGRKPSVDNIGSWFTTDPDSAKNYGPVTMPTYLRIEKPLVFEGDGVTPQLSSKRLWEFVKEEGGPDEFRRKAMEEGYDGVLIKNDQLDHQAGDVWVAFNPEQIKSAIGNRGTFDPNSDNILHQSATIRAGQETLEKFGLNPNGKYTTREIAAALEARQRAKYGSIAPDDRSPEALKKIAKWMQQEVEFEMQRPAKSGVGWYSEKFQRALDTMGELYPELKKQKPARDLMTALIAITSDGQKVVPNFTQALEIYGRFRPGGETEGKFTTERGHARQASIENNLGVLQRVFDKFGPKKMHDFLMHEATVSELKQIAKAHGGEMKTDYQAHIKMPMAAVEFGPNLGAFYANLMGSHGYLTMDRWWSRTFNRYRGTLLDAPTRQGMDRLKLLLGKPRMSDDRALAATVEPRNSYAKKGYKNGTELEVAANTIYKAAFENLNDLPFTPKDRTFMLDAVNQAQKNLAKRGYNLSVADIQAILWYYEKRLYGELGARQSADISYEDAAKNVVAKALSGDRAGQPVQESEPAKTEGNAGEPGGSVPAEPAPGTDTYTGPDLNHPLYQAAPNSPEGTRGWFRVLPDGRYEIGKTKIGDFSTFIHEPAHAYLELFRTLTQRAEASDELKKDFAKIAEWLGTTPEDAQKNGFTREQHEKWAEANEAYVQEGKAPTAGLQRAFHNFAVWLTSIYGRIKRGGLAELSPEIRSVMDRLYAGDAAVDRAAQESGRQQLFESPEEAGWTQQEFQNYARGRGVEEAEARRMILREMKEAADRERSDSFREETGNVRDAVTAEVDQRPEYRAIRQLRKGELEDGTPFALNRGELVKQFGEERVKALQDMHRGLYRAEGGVDAETAAEMFGFGSGEEMMQALENAPRRALAIEQGTRDYLIRKYGDVRYDGTLNDRARFALENNERSGNIYRELRALKARVAVLEKKAADAKAAMQSITIEPLEHYQEAARQMIDAKPPADIQPHRYLDASRRFSREAFEALRKGNVKGAADAKNKELLNHFLFREATNAREYVEKFEKYTQRVQSRGIQQRLGLAGSDYRDQFNWLMSRYRLSGMPPQAPERSLRDWADEVFTQGNEPAIAQGIFDGHSSRFADYRSVPMSELRDVHDALVNIRHLAQQQFKIFVQGKQVKFAEAKQAMMDAARTNLKTKPERVFEENLSKGEKFLRKLQWVDSRLIRMERLVEWLDGGKAGPWHDNLWNLASDAQGDEYKLQEDVTHVVTKALEDMPIDMRRRLWTEKVMVDGIAEPLERRRLLSMAFNMGNEGNLDRLQKTFTAHGWDPAAIKTIGGMLTHDEWMFVQKTWDSLKPMGQRMQELERRLTGLPPQMVKVTPFKVVRQEGGEEINLDGGYFPIVMDPRFSQRAIEQDARETAQNAMQSGYVRATTAKGYTKERTGFGGPLLLDYEQVLTSHVAKVSKDLSHREFMLAAQRFLLDTDVRKTLRETLGPAYEQQFMPWLRTIINDNNGSTQERLDGLKEGMQKLRSNIVAASLGFNASTSLLQISHAPRMMLYAKQASLAQAFLDLLARPREFSQEVRDLSPNEMAFRGDNLDRDIRATLQEPSYQSGFARKAAVAARFALEMMDHVLSYTLWKAAYRDGLDKYADLSPEDAHYKASHEADSAVRLGLGTSAPKDLPAIMRSNEFNKFITTLYGFHNGVYNQLRDIGHQFGRDRSVKKATVASVLTVLVPAVLGNLLTGRGPGTNKKEPDEGFGAWAAKRSLAFAADTVPLLRAIASSIEGGHDVQFSPIESLMTKAAKAGKTAVSDKEDKDWLGIGIDSGEIAGTVMGVPGIHQATKTVRYIRKASQGKLQNPNIWNAVVGGGR